MTIIVTVKKWSIYYQREPFILKPISCFGLIKYGYNCEVIFHVTARHNSIDLSCVENWWS